MRILVLLTLAALALLAPGTASAKVWFDDLQGREFAPWELVTTTMAGCEETGRAVCIPDIAGMPVYAVPFNGQWRTWRCRTAARHHRAGRITPRGRLRFRAPVRPGRYGLVLVAEGDTPCWAAAVSAGWRVVPEER
jgi:hypothetical protein